MYVQCINIINNLNLTNINLIIKLKINPSII